MQRIIWTIMLVIALASLAEAADDTDPGCKEHYASMPSRVRNYIPALILNAKDKGKDVFREDDARTTDLLIQRRNSNGKSI